MDTLLHDLRYALRQLSRNPGFTLVAVLTLALGIGANSAMFGVLDALFLSPPPGVVDADRLTRLYVVRDEGMIQTPTGGGGSHPDYTDLQTSAQSFSAVAGQLSPREMSFGRGESAEEITGAFVTGGYFPTLGTQPALGRFFGPAEDRVTAAPVAVISHALWQNRFAGSPEVVGREIFIEGGRYTVIGVTPEYFHGIDSETIDVWVPTVMAYGAEYLANRLSVGVRIFGRLAPGATVEQARSEATAILRNSAEASGLPIDQTPGLMLAPIIEAMGPKRSQTATTAMWLAAITGAVLLIACANVANLFLARATRRRREIGVRVALGAGRIRLIRQLMTESVVLGVLGGVSALLLTVWSARLIQLFPIPPIPSLIDGRMLVFTFGVALLTGILSGLVPAFKAGRFQLVGALKDGAATGASSRSRIRSALTIVQMALSLALLIAAGLLVRSAVEAGSVDSGIDIDRLLYVSVDLTEAGYDESAQNAFIDRALESITAMPAITHASTAQMAPLSGTSYGMGFEIPGIESLPEVQDGPFVNFVSGGFFQTVGSSVIRGREFTESDRQGSRPVVIVNERMANLYWPGGNAIGSCMAILQTPCREVVGVTEDIKHHLLEETVPKYFIPMDQQNRFPGATNTIILRTAGDPNSVIGDVQRLVHGLAPNLPYVSVLPVTELIGPDLQPFRLGATLFSLFGALALTLAAIGLYGVVSFSVSQRTREIGVRMALGAEGHNVLRLVVSRSLGLALIGAILGTLGAVAATRFMQSLLFGVEPLDPVAFMAAPAILISVALLASYLPARRATRVDPVTALRSE